MTGEEPTTDQPVDGQELVESPVEGAPATLHQLLHDLVQPLTAMQIRLDMGTYSHNTNELKEALSSSRRELERVMALITALRGVLFQKPSRESTH